MGNSANTTQRKVKTHTAKMKVEKLDNPEPIGLNTVEGLNAEFDNVLKAVEEPKSTHKVTAPWNTDNNPWSRDMLKLTKKRPGYRQRFVTKNIENIEKYLDQGWAVADKKDYGGVSAKIAGEEGQIDTTIKRRELILMEIPEELAKQRDAYIDHKTNRRVEVDSEVRDVERKLGSKVLTEDRMESRKGRYV
jgi:hypothetical protein